MTRAPDEARDDVLASEAAGGMVARGGLARVVAYGLGTALTTGATVVLLRHLGLVDFGRYATVIALVTIAGGIADAGLTVVGQREYVLARGVGDRRRVLGDVATLRLVLAPLGVGIAALFALVSGQPSEMVAGVVIAGVGVVCASLATSLAIPLGARLRLPAIAMTELARQAALAAALVALVAAGARLPLIFAAQVIGGLALLAATLAVARGDLAAPSFDLRRSLALARRALTVGLSLVLGTIYVRVLVIVVFLLGSRGDAGVYGAASRVIEIVAVVPLLIVGSAFPLLAHAGAADDARLRETLRRLAGDGLVLAGLLAVGVGLAADPIVRALGGEEFAAAAPILRILCATVPALFLTHVWTGALLAVHAQRAVLRVNATGLVAVIVLGGALVSTNGPEGAAVAAVVGESGIAALAWLLLRRARPGARPGARSPWKPALAALAGVAGGVLSGAGDVPGAVVGCGVYAAVLWAVGGVPTLRSGARASR